MGERNEIDNFERIYKDEVSDVLQGNGLEDTPADITGMEADKNENGLENGANDEKRQSAWEWGWGTGALVATLFMIVLATACETLYTWANQRKNIGKHYKKLKGDKRSIRDSSNDYDDADEAV